MANSVSLAHQLRARESMRFAPSGGVPSHAAAPTHMHRSSRGPMVSDKLDPASLCAQSLRTLPSHFQHILLGHTGCVNAVAVSEGSGRWVATGGDDKSVLLWEAYAPLKAIYPLHQSRVHEPLGVDNAAAAASSVVRLSPHSYPCAGHIHRGPTAAYRGHRANIFGITFTADSRRILSCGLDAGILMYDLETSGGGREMRPPLRSFVGHQSSVHRVSLLPGSNDVFLSASNDRTVRLFDARCSTSHAQFVGGFSYSINSVHANPADANMFVTAGESLCLHDVRRMGATKHNEDAQRRAAGAGAGASAGSGSASAPSASSRTRRATRARQLARRALALMGGDAAMAEDDDSDGEEGAGEEEEGENEDDFTSLVEFMLSAATHARPMAVLKKFDLATLTPARARRAPKPAAASSASAVPPRRSPRTARGAAASAAGGASGASRGRGAGSSSGSGARGSRASAAAASQVDAAVPATASRARGRGRGARGARGGRGASSSRGRPSSRGRAAEEDDDDERMHDEEEEEEQEDQEEEDDAERIELEAGRAPAPRRSGRLRAGASAEEEERAEQLGIEEVSSNDDGEESEGHYLTPSERRRARLSSAAPPREASSCEFSADGQFVLACMMKSTPLLFRTDQRRPVVALQSHGAAAGYSNTCTLKSAVFGGPDERFVIAGSDNFGIYLWDRTLPHSDVLASPETNPENKATFLNAFKIIRGHRSIPNNQRFHPQLQQIYSCGVEKVVRAFHCTRAAEPPASVARRAAEAAEAEGGPDGREESFLRDGDVLTEAETRRILRAHRLLSPASSPASASPSPSGESRSSGRAKRKLAGSDSATQLEEKKAKGEGDAPVDEDKSADASMANTAGDSAASSPSATAAASASTSAASPSSSPPARSTRSATAASAGGDSAGSSRSRRSTRAAAAAAAAATADRSAASSPDHEPRRGGAGAGPGSSSRPASPELDPLYRMVRTYHRPRDPYTRLQCAYLLSGGADAFGSAASLFADGDPEEAAELAAGGDDGRDDDSMAEDRACIAQFDWYVSKAAAGEDDEEDEEDTSDFDGLSDEDENEDEDGSGDDSDSGPAGRSANFIISTDDLRALASGRQPGAE